jgi:5-methyltetrahydropteroyltriglutamate--homocysteine methyltransferase
MCYGNSRESDSLYPRVNASCLAELFTSGQSIDWHEIHVETARPGMSEMGALSAWTVRDGKYLGIGVIEVMNPHVETPEQVAGRIRAALERVAAGRLIVSTDCGLYQLPRDLAFRKLRSLVAGTRIVRRELGRRADGTP